MRDRADGLNVSDYSLPTTIVCTCHHAHNILQPPRGLFNLAGFAAQRFTRFETATRIRLYSGLGYTNLEVYLNPGCIWLQVRESCFLFYSFGCMYLLILIGDIKRRVRNAVFLIISLTAYSCVRVRECLHLLYRFQELN